jgi:hypothetical protein
MTPIELVGFKAIITQLVSDDKRSVAFTILDHFFSKATTLAELDAIGELSLKKEHRELFLKCAEAGYAMALSTDEKQAARTNLIKAYNLMNYPEKALHYIELQLGITPDDFDMICQKAANIALLGDKQTSEDLILGLISKNPHKEIELGAMLSGKYLREGQLSKGVQSFVECFKPKHHLYEDQLNMKRWSGIVRPGTKIYVEGEGGIGDEIINIRFFDKIKRMGMRPILCSPDTKYYRDKNNLFRRHGIEILSESYSIDSKSPWVPMMSLPAVLGLTEDDLWKGTYLTPLRNPKNELPKSRFKIGIKCSGNPFFAQDEYRKIPLEQMLAGLPKEADIYYIDTVDGHPGTIDLADRIDSWEDTLDFIDQMDCIVSSCTSLVHAAGAIGKTTFVAVPIAEYYIWTSSRTDTSIPWYGSNFHVMRQKKLRDWTEPLASISTHVKTLFDNKLN